MGIYSELEEQASFNYKNGDMELQQIYKGINFTICKQDRLANKAILMIIDVYKRQGTYKDIEIEDTNLIDYGVALIMKVNAAVKSGIIPLAWIKTLTEELIYKSSIHIQVKLGLLLSEKYLSLNKLKEVVKVYSKDGEYIFYLFRSIRNLKNYDEFLFKLLKRTKGTIKFFALTNIDLYKDKEIEYLINEGYQDNMYEELNIEFILTSCDMSSYLQSIKEDEVGINKLSVIIYKHLRYNSFEKSIIKDFIVNEFIDVVKENGSDFYSLMVMLLISQGMAVESNIGNKEKFMPMAMYLKEDKWKKTFLKELSGNRASTLDIIEMANFYDYNLSIEKLKALYSKNNLDYYLYWYVNNKESEDKRRVFLNYFLQSIDIDQLLYKNKEENLLKIKDTSLKEKLLYEVLKGCANIFPEGKDLALKAIEVKSLEIRSEAVKCLLIHKDKLTKEEMEAIAAIEASIDVEENYRFKVMFNSLIAIENKYKVEFINKVELDGTKITRHGKDAKLMSTYVSDYIYRDLELLIKELKSSKIFYLKLEEDNVYDNKAVKIIGESGYVIGYIPKKDNEVLSNLLINKLYVYCVVREYSLEENHISLDIYLSYKNVLDEIGEVINVINAKNEVRYKS